MLAQEIRIRGEPTADPQKCRFVLDAEVLSRSPVSFDNESDTSKAPLAQKLLALPYIAGVSISGSAVTLTGDNVESWPAIGKEIGGVIRDQIKTGEPAVEEEVMDIGDADLFTQVNLLIKNDVNKYKRFIDISDIILFDSKGYHKSESFDHNLLNGVSKKLNKMIAGNIQIDDIPSFKNKDFIIDLSGALEDEKGEKDINRINKLLNLSSKI